MNKIFYVYFFTLQIIVGLISPIILINFKKTINLNNIFDTISDEGNIIFLIFCITFS